MQKCPLSLLTYLLHIGPYVSVSLQCCCIVMKCCDCCLIIRRCRCCMKQAVGSGTRWDNSASICPTTTFEPWWSLSASARAAKSHFKVELCACRLAVMAGTCAGSDVVLFYRWDALSTAKPTASEQGVRTWWDCFRYLRQWLLSYCCLVKHHVLFFTHFLNCLD